jgi:hypothetical protein
VHYLAAPLFAALFVTAEVFRLTGFLGTVFLGDGRLGDAFPEFTLPAAGRARAFLPALDAFTEVGFDAALPAGDFFADGLADVGFFKDGLPETAFLGRAFFGVAFFEAVFFAVVRLGTGCLTAAFSCSAFAVAAFRVVTLAATALPAADLRGDVSAA